MAGFLEPVLTDPRWQELDRTKRARAREKLFIEYVKADDGRREVFAAATEEKQAELYQEFARRAGEQYPEAFATKTSRTETLEQPAVMTTGQALTGGGRARKVERKVEETVPVLDPETEEKLAKGDFKSWEAADFARLGPLVDVLAPERRYEARAAAKEKLGMGSPAAESAKEVARGLARPLTEARELANRALAGVNPVSRMMAEGDKGQAVEDEARTWALGSERGLEAAGAVAGLVAGGAGVARAALGAGSRAGLNATRGAITRMALGDAALGAGYSKSAPGFLAAAAKEMTQEDNATRDAVLTAVEAGGLSAVAGVALRRATIGQMKAWARENLGWTGTKLDDLREFVRGKGAAAAEPRNVTPERPAEIEAAPETRAEAQFLAKRGVDAPPLPPKPAEMPKALAITIEGGVPGGEAAVRAVPQANASPVPQSPLPEAPSVRVLDVDADSGAALARAGDRFPGDLVPPEEAPAGAGGVENSFDMPPPRGTGASGAGTISADAPPAADAGQAASGATRPTWHYDVQEPVAPHAVWGDEVKVPFAGLEKVRPLQMPELVRIARELSGTVPRVRKMSGALGQMQSTGAGTIKLHPSIFLNPDIAQRVLAHELGHLVDYLPDRTLNRGNLLGRLATLRDYLAKTLDLAPTDPSRALTPKDRAEIRKKARQEFAGMEADPEAVSARYREMVDAEIEGRKLAKEEVVREELIALSDEWKPFLDDVAKGAVPTSYVNYRQSGKELIADFISVLFNDPAMAKGRAPKAWAMFWNYIDRKPEVKRALMDVQALLEAGPDAVRARRRADLLSGFQRGEEVFLRKVAERKAAGESFRGWAQRVRQDFIDHFAPITDRAHKVAKGGDARGQAVEWLFDEHPLAYDARNYVLMQDAYERVVKPAQAAGLAMEDVGEVLLLNRVAREQTMVTARELAGGEAPTHKGRADLANPLGFDPQTARTQLLYLRSVHGPRKWQALEGAVEAFHDVAWKVVEEAVRLGSYNKQTFEEVIAPNRGNYATFAVVDYLQDWIPAGVRQQKGTLSEVANPLLATLLKVAALNRLNQLQKVKRGAVRFLQEFFPAEIKPADVVWDGKGRRPRPNPDPQGGMVTLLDDGHLTGYWVPRDIEQAFEGITPARANAAIEVLNFAFRRVFYPMFITYNPVFQLAMGPIRDARRAFRNLPGLSGLRQTGEYLRNLASLSVEAMNVPLRGVGAPQIPVPMSAAGRSARNFLTGKPDELVREMMQVGAIGTPLDTFTTGPGVGGSIGELMRRFRLLPDKDRGHFRRARFLEPAMRLLRAIEYAGLTMEMLPKMSAFAHLTRRRGVAPREAAAMVRNHVGVPNFKRTGRHTRVVGTLFPFFNVFAQGIRDDYRLATGRKSAGGFWLRWALGSGVWRMLQAAGAAGLLGAGIKEMYDYVSEYDKTNYGVVPLGWVDGGEFDGRRVLRLRIPEDETDRLLGGLLHKAMSGLAGEEAGKWQQLLGFAGGQVPGINPAVEIAGA